MWLILLFGLMFGYQVDRPDPPIRTKPDLCQMRADAPSTHRSPVC